MKKNEVLVTEIWGKKGSYKLYLGNPRDGLLMRSHDESFLLKPYMIKKIWEAPKTRGEQLREYLENNFSDG